MAIHCEFCGERMTSAPSHMDHNETCLGNPRVALLQFLTAYEVLRHRFGDDYAGRFAELDVLVSRYEKLREKAPKPR